MRRAIWLLLALAGTLQLPVAATADDSLPYLARIGVERASTEFAGLGDAVSSILHVSDPTVVIASLSAMNDVRVIDSDQSTVHIEFGRKPTLAAVPGQQHQVSSFVLDFDEASVRRLSDDLRAQLERRPEIDELVAYVHEHIVDKSYTRGFDLASQVADSGAGDCTEHAVLLAALARSHGYAARVVFGALLLDTAAETLAFGHAWTEIHDGSDWQIKDATLPAADADPGAVRYLPLSALDDEGPGYGYSMLYVMQSIPSRITALGNPD